jgi:hypothetical protein
MERGEVPPNWEDLYRLSKESATDKSFNLALKWISGQKIDVDREGNLLPIQEQISNPFNIVPDQRNPALDHFRAEFNPDIGTNLAVASKGECDNSSQVKPSFSMVAAAKPLPDVAPVERVGITVNLMKDFDAKVATMSLPPTPAIEILMPQQVNLDKLGLRCSKGIAEQQQKEKHNHKAHVTFGSTAKQVLGLFALICMVDTYRMPCHQTSLTSSFSKKLIKCFDKANEHCDGTLNDFHFVSLHTDTGSKEFFTYHQAQKQEDWNDFIIAMEKEILDNKSHGHWDLVPCPTIPSGNKVIKAIWSFKCKHFLDGCLNKHKARLCAHGHGGMQRWGENYWETYSPVVNMISKKLLLAIAKMHGLESKSIDFVLAFPQAGLDKDIWMDLPIGF